MECNICPKRCGVDRSLYKGACGCSQTMVIAHSGLHMWEEPCISGKHGSGAIFFSGCNLKCVFCQNYRISHTIFGQEATVLDLIELMKRLECMGAENINLVSPTQYTMQIISALELYHPSVPVIWNSSGYELKETIQKLDGLIDIYLPDLKYFDNKYSLKYSSAQDYFKYASEAILEMYRQTGIAKFNGDMMKSGTIIRHLVLPALTNQTYKILEWIKTNLPDVHISLLAQYFPSGCANQYPEINRKLMRKEYNRVVDYMMKLGLYNGFIQQMSSAQQCYVPDFKGSF